MDNEAIQRERVRQSVRFHPFREDDPCTLVFTTINGTEYTVVIRNDGIAQRLGKKGTALMVEECSDFVSAHQAQIAAAAARSLASRGTVDGRILLFPDDL